VCLVQRREPRGGAGMPFVQLSHPSDTDRGQFLRPSQSIGVKKRLFKSAATSIGGF
jgi:hypothetical protein